ncbi:MAG: 60S ribosomal export protein NMD3, partial [Halobacteriaceae archaeon]
MTATREFCPECGTPTSREPDRDMAGTRQEQLLCDSCYFDRFDLIDAPEQVQLPICSGCGSVKLEDGWEDIDDGDYTDAAIEAVSGNLGVHANASEISWSVSPEQLDATTIRMHCDFSGVVRDSLLEASETVLVQLSRGTCSRCGRIAGDYYAAVLQLRADDRDPSDEEIDRAIELARSAVSDRSASGNRDAFISDIDRSVSGVDIKLSETQLARGIAKRIKGELGGDVTDSKRLITEDEDGEPVYRVTYSVRLPPYAPGTIIDPEDGDGPVLVRSARGNLKGIRLA